MDPDRFLTHSLRDMRIARILAAALDSVEPGGLVRESLAASPLPAHERLYILGLGKAAEPMVAAAAQAHPDFAAALAITKHASLALDPRIQIVEAGHPVPDARSVMAGRAALDLAARVTAKDMLLCLISGGGSALATSPRSGIGLRDIQIITTELLRSGADIEDINTLRRHLDAFKGGGLARAARGRVHTLLLSDVMGDRLEVIASGPTAPDPTSDADALTVLNRYGVQAPANIYSILSAHRSATQPLPPRVTHTVIANNRVAAQAAAAQAEADGLHATLVPSHLRGEARRVGDQLARLLRDAAASDARPFCRIFGGETTVTITGDGKGGRNQELALAAVAALDGQQGCMLIALATDGDDGPTDAAGAVVTGETAQRARAARLHADDFLERNDSYSYFAALGDLLKPGYTGTNVNDLVLLIGQ